MQDFLISCRTYVPGLLQNAGSGLCKLQESVEKDPVKCDCNLTGKYLNISGELT